MDAELMRRRGIQVGHSLNMIAEFPHYAYDPVVATALRAAAFDAFFMYLRLLVDFLITKPRRDRPPVISRWDYVQDAHLDGSLRHRLQAASQWPGRGSRRLAPSPGRRSGSQPGAITGYGDDAKIVLAYADLSLPVATA